MATIKKAQKGVVVDKTATRKPKGTLIIRNKPKGDYMSFSGKTPTKKDSSDYKKGYNFGVESRKNSALYKGLSSNKAWNAGNEEGVEDKRPVKKIKLKSGGTVKKTIKKSSKK